MHTEQMSTMQFKPFPSPHRASESQIRELHSADSALSSALSSGGYVGRAKSLSAYLPGSGRDRDCQGPFRSLSAPTIRSENDMLFEESSLAQNLLQEWETSGVADLNGTFFDQTLWPLCDKPSLLSRASAETNSVSTQNYHSRAVPWSDSAPSASFPNSFTNPYVDMTPPQNGYYQMTTSGDQAELWRSEISLSDAFVDQRGPEFASKFLSSHFFDASSGSSPADSPASSSNSSSTSRRNSLKMNQIKSSPSPSHGFLGFDSFESVSEKGREPSPSSSESGSGKPRRFPCLTPGCPRRFTSQYTLKVHMEAHKPKARVSFECTLGCSEKFSRQHDRLRHEVSKHGKICDWVCHECGRFFSSKATLGHHKCPIAQGGMRWV